MIFPLALFLNLDDGVAFFALPVGPCLPIVGSGTALFVFAFVPTIFGGGTLGAIARLNGVFAGVDGGVGGRPMDGCAELSGLVADNSRGFRNIASGYDPFHCRLDEVLDLTCVMKSTMTRK